MIKITRCTCSDEELEYFAECYQKSTEKEQGIPFEQYLLQKINEPSTV